MKKADKPSIVIITGDNNKVSFGGTSSHRSVIVVFAVLALIAIAVLAISHCCPDLLADFVRWIIGIAVNS